MRKFLPAMPKLGFVLFILVNAALFVQISELVPALNRWPIYEGLLVACLLVSIGPVIEKLSLDSLLENPITACVVGLVVAAVLSQLIHLRARPAVASGVELAELALYYLLLVSVVKTPSQFKRFLGCLTIFAAAQIGLAVLQYHRIIDIPSLRPLTEEATSAADNRIVTQFRMCGAGIFNDPNDLGVLAAMTIALCAYQLEAAVRKSVRNRWLRLILWTPALLLCTYALMRTQSRGAFIALLSALVAMGVVRLGWKKSMIAAVIVLPVLMIVFAGRQSNISVRRTTAQSRLEFWSRGLSLFVHSPILGIGQDEFRRVVGRVTHNSFIQCFAEMGFLGGAFFLGAFYLAIWPVFRLRWKSAEPNSELFLIRPYLLGAIVSWTAGMLTLSRSYVPPTYMILGIATVYLGLVMQEQSLPRLRVDARLAARVAGLSVAFLIGVYLFVRVFHHA